LLSNRIVPWVAVAIAGAGLGLTVGAKLFFGAIEGAALTTRLEGHMVEAGKIQSQQILTNERILNSLDNIHQEQVEIGKDLSAIKAVRASRRNRARERDNNGD